MSLSSQSSHQDRQIEKCASGSARLLFIRCRNSVTLGAMPITPQTKISPRYLVSDWTSLRPELNDAGNTESWTRAIDIVNDRIQNRFLEPIDRLRDQPESAELGFGFAMLALDCLLIDTIQSFREGRTRGSEARTTKAFVDFFRGSGGPRQVACNAFEADRTTVRAQDSLIRRAALAQHSAKRWHQPGNRINIVQCVLFSKSFTT